VSDSNQVIFWILLENASASLLRFLRRQRPRIHVHKPCARAWYNRWHPLRSRCIFYLSSKPFQIVHITHMVPLPSTHFFPMSESIRSALAKMKHLDLAWIGVFCSDPGILQPSSHTLVDQTTLNALMKESATTTGIKLFVQSTSPTALVSPKISLVPFSIQTPDETAPGPDVVSSRLVVDYSAHSNPNINRELHLNLAAHLNLARLVYTALSFDYTPARPNSRLLLDSGFDGYLTQFYRFGMVWRGWV
jgi:hypothetical protein